VDGLFEDDNAVRGKRTVAERIRDKTKKEPKKIVLRVKQAPDSIDPQKLASMASAPDPGVEFNDVNVKKVKADQEKKADDGIIVPLINYVGDTDVP
jgi:hypothetical protein